MFIKLDYVSKIKDLYSKNNTFNFVYLAVIETEKSFNGIISGKDKKAVLKRTIEMINRDIIDPDLIDNIIELVFYIRDNRKLLKVIDGGMKKCGCIK